MIRITFKNPILIYLSVMLSISSCKKDKYENHKITVIKENSLTKVKDTVIFVDSSQGEDIKLFINPNTHDSILESEVFGETGMAKYKFTFNKQLKTGECITLRYSKPLHIDPNPKIASEKKENLQSSKESSERLTDIFDDYLKVLLNQNKKNNTDIKWSGKYSLVLNENNEDWRDMHEIELNISQDSITYLAKGFQLYQFYLLSSTKKDNSIALKFEKALDNTESLALKKTKDFGRITFDGKNYLWTSPYLDSNFTDGKNKKYILKKIQ